jgi:hypothetical protein
MLSKTLRFLRAVLVAWRRVALMVLKYGFVREVERVAIKGEGMLGRGSG